MDEDEINRRTWLLLEHGFPHAHPTPLPRRRKEDGVTKNKEGRTQAACCHCGGTEIDASHRFRTSACCQKAMPLMTEGERAALQEKHVRECACGE